LSGPMSGNRRGFRSFLTWGVIDEAVHEGAGG